MLQQRHCTCLMYFKCSRAPCSAHDCPVQNGVQRPHKQPKGKHKPAQQAQDEEEEDSADEEVDEEDLDFVRRLGAPAAAFLSSLDATEAVKYVMIIDKLTVLCVTARAMT